MGSLLRPLQTHIQHFGKAIIVATRRHTVSAALHGTVSSYSPVANAIAQDRAAAQIEAMISGAIEQGQANMAALEKTIIEDNAIMPGEWYGRAFVFEAPQDENGKNLQISVKVGPDRHEFNVDVCSFSRITSCYRQKGRMRVSLDLLTELVRLPRSGAISIWLHNPRGVTGCPGLHF